MRIILSIILSIQLSISFSQSEGFEVIKNLELMDQIYEHLDKYYVDNPKPGKMAVAGIHAMLRDLDPYTVFYPESDIEDYRLMTTGQYGGIGALIRKVDDHVIITEPYQGNPAAESGLKAGDKILSIDGNSMKNKSSEEVSNSLKGPKGTAIEIEVERNGSQKKYKVTRAEIKLPDVPYAGMISDKIGYIKLNSFTQTASQSVKTSFTDLKSQGMESLILDLRGNGGGLLMEAVRIVNMFVDKGQTVVTTKGRVVEENRTYKTMDEPMDLKIPIVVLIDEGSASASEIVSGSLQDLDRAVIVGETSYGKGLVQRTYDLSYGTKVKITIAKYYTPSGRCVQRLEYYDKAEDERPEEIPDSLIKIFKTENGREVIDGRGIEPDIHVDVKELSRLTATIYAKNLIFNYATDYSYQHESIADPKAFSLTDSEYEDFKAYVLKQDFTYSTATEEMLKKVLKVSEEEGFDKDTEVEYNALMNKVTPSKERDLEKFKSEVKMLLENEIISRYHYQEGRAINSFKHDDVLTKAKGILENNSNYNTILGN